MPVENHDQWPEHAVCARCAAPLGQDYGESPLGLRFCKDCFDNAVQEKARERAAEIYLRGRCSNCGRSLINGYRLNKYGVLYCLSCHEDLPRSSQDPTTDTKKDANDIEQKVELIKWETAAEGMLWLSLGVCHVLLFLNILINPFRNPFLPHPGSFFRGVICLDLLTLVLLLASGSIIKPRHTSVWALLIASGFIILIMREIMGLLW